MADLFLAVDTGGSQTKIIFQLPSQKSPDTLLMPPEMEQISQQQFDSYQERIGWLGSPSPQQQAWLTVGDELWVVGAFASEFDPTDRLMEKKYENALYKVLAAVGILAQQLALKGPRLAVQLAVLLPWQEFNDRKTFETQLRSMLANFSFRGQKFKVKLTQFLCRPEGGGLAATRMRTQGLDWFQKQRLVVLLFGHRNTSALYFENGQFKQGDSPLYGFSQLINLIVARYSVLDNQALVMALVKAMAEARETHRQQNQAFEDATRGRYGRRLGNQMAYPAWQKTRAIQGLVSVRRETLREAEVAALAKAINAAVAEYWQKLVAWMERVLPDDLNEVVVSGGAARFLQPKLERHFHVDNRKRNFSGQLVWDADLQQPMETVFRWKHRRKELLVPRFADAYGLFDQMLLLATEGAI